MFDADCALPADAASYDYSMHDDALVKLEGTTEQGHLGSAATTGDVDVDGDSDLIAGPMPSISAASSAGVMVPRSACMGGQRNRSFSSCLYSNRNPLWIRRSADTRERTSAKTSSKSQSRPHVPSPAPKVC